MFALHTSPLAGLQAFPSGLRSWHPLVVSLLNFYLAADSSRIPRNLRSYNVHLDSNLHAPFTSTCPLFGLYPFLNKAWTVLYLSSLSRSCSKTAPALRPSHLRGLSAVPACTCPRHSSTRPPAYFPDQISLCQPVKKPTCANC